MAGEEEAVGVLRDAMSRSRLSEIDDVSKVEWARELGPHFVLALTVDGVERAFRVAVVEIEGEG